MHTLKLMLSTAMMNLRGLPSRRTSSLVMIISIAGVVAVFSGVLAMNAGLNGAMRDSGRVDRVVVLRAGSTVEIASAISQEELTVIKNAASAFVRNDSDGVPLVTAEAVAPLTLIEKHNGIEINATLRGVGPESSKVRPEIKIIAGRMFEPGKYEIVVGQQALRQFRNLKLGDEVTAYQTRWKIVGVFAADGSYRESELMADANVVMGVSQRPMFQNVTVALQSPDAFNSFRKVLDSNPSIAMDVFTEPEFLHRESSNLNELLGFLAYVMGGIMAVGAVFVAFNAIYSSIDDRRREIAALRAIGFPSFVVVSSIITEAALLALVGGLLGALVAWLMVNGNVVSTAVGSDLRQLVFEMAITPQVVLKGLCAALAIGIVGGVIPAVRSIRSKIVSDLLAI